MMLHRSTSVRRKSKTSRNFGNSSQNSAVVGGRRASLASVTSVTSSSSKTSDSMSNLLSMEKPRAPRRGSTVPNISLNPDDNDEEVFNRRILPLDPETATSRASTFLDSTRSPRQSLIPDDYNRSPRSSLVPNDSMRGSRNSLAPEVSRSPWNSLVPEITRSPRHSLVPDVALSPRNSLIPADPGYSRSPRNSLINQGSSRSLLSDNGVSSTRSSRHSLVPEPLRSSRGSVANIDFDRNPRGSICPDVSRSQHRGSVAISVDMERSPRGSISSECHNQSPRGSIGPDPLRSPRGSIGLDTSRSPRGSVCPDINRSPRGSICLDASRSPRGSIGMFAEFGRIGVGAVEQERSPRGSIDRGVGQERRILPRTVLDSQEPKRTSNDQVSGTTKYQSTSPYRQREVNTSIVRSVDSGGPQINLSYGTNAWIDSRRASSSVSQISGDESRRLCGPGSADLLKKGSVNPAHSGVAAYGSLVFQLKDANLEANSTCDFVFRALRVVSKTMVVTVCLACLSTMPILMLIIGIQFIKECPREPHIPLYLIVGGMLGSVRIFWTLYSQIRSRRPEVLTVHGVRSHLSFTKLASILLSCFLIGWFALGNYWILHIRWPDYAGTLFEPNLWCDKTLYIFSLVHLYVVYTVLSASLLTALSLFVCRLMSCSFLERYK